MPLFETLSSILSAGVSTSSSGNVSQLSVNSSAVHTNDLGKPPRDYEPIVHNGRKFMVDLLNGKIKEKAPAFEEADISEHDGATTSSPVFRSEETGEYYSYSSDGTKAALEMVKPPRDYESVVENGRKFMVDLIGGKIKEKAPVFEEGVIDGNNKVKSKPVYLSEETGEYYSYSRDGTKSALEMVKPPRDYETVIQDGRKYKVDLISGNIKEKAPAIEAGVIDGNHKVKSKPVYISQETGEYYSYSRDGTKSALTFTPDN